MEKNRHQTISDTPKAAYRAARPTKRIEPTKPLSTAVVSKPVKALKRVAAYARVSSDHEEQESSYVLQCEHYENYIKNHEGWTLIKVYADEGKTGTSTRGRTQFRQMISDCEAGLIDMIITKSISRFARNTVDCLETVRRLKNLPHPVGVYFEKENIDSLDGRSELLLTILSSLAQDESRSISENIRWALQKRYEAGYVRCTTTNLLGYDTAVDPATGEKRMVIEPEGAAAVRMVYDAFLRGMGYSAIAHQMEQLGAKTGAGKTNWSAVTVRRILTNEKYVGDVYTQKGYTRDFLTHTRALNAGEMPKYYAEDHHEAIVDRKTWNAVQKMIQAGEGQRRGTSAKRDTGSVPHVSKRTVFSSRLYCDRCGAPLIRRSTNSSRIWHGSTRYFIWRCRSAEGRGKRYCTAGSSSEIVLEQTFMAMLSEMAKRDPNELIEEFRAVNGVEPADAPENADELRRELARIDAQLERMAADPELYADMLEDLKAQKAETEAALHPQPDWSYVNPLKKASFDWFLTQLQDIPVDYDPAHMTPPFRADIFSRCVARGVVKDLEDGERVIRYTFSFGLEAVAFGNKRSITEARKIADRGMGEKQNGE